MRITLFITCLTDTFEPRAGIALVKVLEHLGHEVVFPAAQTCCGQPMFNNGYADEARALVLRMMDVFEGAETIVSPSASCAAFLRRHAPHLFEDDPAVKARAAAFGARVLELAELLTGPLAVDLATLGARWEGEVAYHFSCHSRDLGLSDHVPRLLGGIDGLRLLPLPRAEQCCGFGGTFAVSYDDISGVMVRDKVDAIETSGASHVLCSDAGCGMNIGGALHRAGAPTRLLSLAELIAESLGLLERPDVQVTA